jgi:HAD superfamily hydrolase (TIGR01509 family)
VRDPRLVIFDCDGVLVDSEGISNAVLARFLNAVGLTTTVEQTRRSYQGLLLRDVVSGVESRLGRSLPSDWLTRFERERAQAFRRELAPVPGAARAVEHVKAAGLDVCVASQGSLEKTRLSLELTGLQRLFPHAAVFSAHSVARGKPYPNLFLHAASAMGAQPERCVVVEDTALGVRAAVSAGMRALGFGADSDEAALRDAGADVFHRFDELPGQLGLDGRRTSKHAS